MSRSVLILALMGMASGAFARTQSFTVVVRDHLKQTSSEVRLTAKLWDSTAGAWTGTRPGLDGLPTPQPWIENGVLKYRKPLSPIVATVAWPGRITARLDADGHQLCSASLIGPKFALTAAHCIHAESTDLPIDQGWVTDSFFLRPGYNLGRSITGFDQIRVVKTWMSRTKFGSIPKYPGDDEWAILELEQDVGTELGWARVTPIDYGSPYQWVHMMGYPGVPTYCDPASGCDTSTKTDSLCHSWSDMLYQPDIGSAMAWNPMTESWGGESGSGVFRCPDDSCHLGKIDVVGIRWTVNGIGSFDSLMSGVVAAILKDVKVPSGTITKLILPGFSLFASGSTLNGAADRKGQWQILSLDGRSIANPGYGRSFGIDLASLRSGIVIVVFQARGEMPVTHRWLVH